jgi:hypothetical protein
VDISNSVDFGSQVGGYLSGLLMGELADALHLNGFEGQLVTTIANVPVSRALTALINYSTGTVTGTALQGYETISNAFATAFDPTALATAGVTAIASMVGTQLARNNSIEVVALSAINDNMLYVIHTKAG